MVKSVVAALLKRRLKVKYGVLGSILHYVIKPVRVFPFRIPGTYIWRRKENCKMAFSEYKRWAYVRTDTTIYRGIW